jgi:hypothetical protein
MVSEEALWEASSWASTLALHRELPAAEDRVLHLHHKGVNGQEMEGRWVCMGVTKFVWGFVEGY